MTPIEGLPIDDKNYIITWIGSSTRDEEKNFKVEIHLESISDEDLSNRQVWKSVRYKESKIYIHVKFIPLLRIGSVFKNQIRILIDVFKPYRLEIFDPYSLSFDKILNYLSKSEEYGKQQAVRYKLMGTFTHSYYCHVPISKFNLKSENGEIQNPDAILIPCYEILRFHYFRSDNLTEAYYNGATENLALIYNKEKSDFHEELTGQPTIVLNNDMLFTDAPLIYRMVNNEEAKEQIMNFYDNASVKFFNKRNAPFICKIPYTEKIKWKISGRWMINKDPQIRYKNIFLVTQINSQDKQFDFNQLNVFKDVTIANIDSEEEKQVSKIIPGENGTYILNPTFQNKSRNFILSNEEDNENYKGLKCTIGYIDDGEIIEKQTVDFYLLEKGKFIELEKDDNSKKPLEKKTKTYQRESEEVLDKALINFINALNQCSNIQIKYLQLEPDDIDQRTTNFPARLFSNGLSKDSEEFKWLHCIYDRESRTWSKKRRAVFAEISKNGNFCYFVRIRPRYHRKEISMQFIHTKNNRQLTHQEELDILYYLGYGMGRLHPDNTLRGKIYCIGGKVPDSDDLNKYSKKLEKKLEEAITYKENVTYD